MTTLSPVKLIQGSWTVKVTVVDAFKAEVLRAQASAYLYPYPTLPSLTLTLTWQGLCVGRDDHQPQAVVS